MTDPTPTQIPPGRPPLFAALPPEVTIYEGCPRDGRQKESDVLPGGPKVELI